MHACECPCMQVCSIHAVVTYIFSDVLRETARTLSAHASHPSRTYVCMYVCIYDRQHSISACIPPFLYVYVCRPCVRMFIRIFLYVRACIYTYIHIHACMYAYLGIHTYIQTNTHHTFKPTSCVCNALSSPIDTLLPSNIYIYIYIYIYIHTHTHIHVYIQVYQLRLQCPLFTH
jgi:hypothetical protein